MPGSSALVDYFLRRRLFYRTDDPSRLVLDARPGWRMVDMFMPSEVHQTNIIRTKSSVLEMGSDY